MTRSALLLALLLLASFVPATASAQETCDGSCSLSDHRAGMVFVANTGLEDLGTLSSSLRHATAAKRSGHLDDVVWLVYGRAIVALDETVGAVPQEVRDRLRAAQEAGVRVVACEVALDKFDIDASSLPDGVQTVPNAVGELARLVKNGYAVVRY